MSEVMAERASLRAARPADLPAVEVLLASAELPRLGAADLLEGAFVVAEAEGAVVGVAGLESHGGDALLRSVAVAPEWRGRGVGEALVRDRVEHARRLGLGHVYLLTTTAERWFPKLGFATVPRDSVPAAVQASEEFATLCPTSAIAMALRLVPRASSCCGGGGGESAVAGARVPEQATSLKAAVRERYGAAATQAAAGGAASCCGSAGREWDPITSDLYESGETAGLPAEALLASLGCGNPTALAELHAGETVLDLGSGGGIDVLLSARRVGPAGFVYGLDMTDEMLALARANQARAGVTNVEFLKGDIESIPLPDASVDVIISNCVINLAADKAAVLREAYRVLRPGGRFAVSDVVARAGVPDEIRTSLELWTGCVAGALTTLEYERLLAEAGFEEIGIEPTRTYSSSDARAILADSGEPVPARLDDYDGAFISAFVRAVKRPGALLV
jgi:arsenite methyltransferase